MLEVGGPSVSVLLPHISMRHSCFRWEIGRLSAKLVAGLGRAIANTMAHILLASLFHHVSVALWLFRDVFAKRSAHN